VRKLNHFSLLGHLPGCDHSSCPRFYDPYTTKLPHAINSLARLLVILFLIKSCGSGKRKGIIGQAKSDEPFHRLQRRPRFVPVSEYNTLYKQLRVSSKAEAQKVTAGLTFTPPLIFRIWLCCKTIAGIRFQLTLSISSRLYACGEKKRPVQ
jgi:hypothetical protein